MAYIANERDLSRITEKKLAIILTTIRSQKNAPAIYQMVVVARRFFDFCVVQGIRSDNPMEYIKTGNPHGKRVQMIPKGSCVNAYCRGFTFVVSLAY